MKRHPGCHGATAATRVPAAVGMVAFLLLALLPGTSGAYLTLAQEAAVMIKLRHDLHSAQPALAQKLVDWRPNSTAVPCGWEMVVCDTQLRITNLDLRWFSPEDKAARRFSPTGMRPVVADSGNASAAGSAPALRLPPELARMRHLEKFSFGMTVRLALPSEWGQPGSFPSLLWLSVHGGSLEGALPDIRPGAMLLLRTIRLQFTSTTVMLPPSWGSRVDVLPALNELERFTLPPEWGAGFPKLELLLLDELGLTGRFPGTWQHGFPALQSM
ncbi:hypothetical protein CHLNCDRAFT_136506 [Chlorella variabilis]|uniref:Leucine-rich repeat-containing N-terminal plant-type domain-containing protein n=1 Tax=Chlorella variabilis TaxID=554065 RepID=E1ZKH2_CHLVA|nr:hypothetical protein CHLNCDRAFT_136506 [Chlorella variabilis]EFN53694.1 hypothetical protein CHLNCDRAFT_136506 [Chlorella variabilis]|eukprot:XP_005845796.1 hypothetical protein CHLNCDRAFT_136506 [Chlorella variabilis]